MIPTRSQQLLKLEATPRFDVVIIGGGINGVGLFRELCLQGTSCLLVEKGDYATGASCATSRMVHGGLRYLENGQFRLVREALLERDRLLANAPHSVIPMPTHIPLFEWTSGLFNAAAKFIGARGKPSPRGALPVKIGLSLYDWFSAGHRALPKHHLLTPNELYRRIPDLRAGAKQGALYYDACVPQPERLVIELIQDALAACPSSIALNYCELVSAREHRLAIRDQLDDSEYEVTPSLVVNAAGAWIDLVNQRLGHPTRYMDGTKGSHLIIRSEALRRNVDHGMLFYENTDGRILVFLPYENFSLVGTTDIRVEDPEDIRCEKEEVEYILESVNTLLPGVKVNAADVVARFSGVRPLARDGASRAGEITRDHSCPSYQLGPDGAATVFSLVGGKWTTFRSFAAATADRILEELGQARRCSTENTPIGGGFGYPSSESKATFIAELAKEGKINLPRARTLFKAYGTKALDFARAESSGSPILGKTGHSLAELRHIASSEEVQRLDDLILRRTRIAYLDTLTPSLLDELLALLGEVRGWNAEQRAAERQRVLTLLHKTHGISLPLREMPRG